MRVATTRLVAATISLVASLFELGTALVRLGAALLLRAAAIVRPRAGGHTAPPRGRPRLRVVRRPDLERERLTSALVGMGFRAPAVHAFVAGLGDRVGREPIEALIKEGLANLAA